MRECRVGGKKKEEKEVSYLIHHHSGSTTDQEGMSSPADIRIQRSCRGFYTVRRAVKLVPQETTAVLAVIVHRTVKSRFLVVHGMVSVGVCVRVLSDRVRVVGTKKEPAGERKESCGGALCGWWQWLVAVGAEGDGGSCLPLQRRKERERERGERGCGCVSVSESVSVRKGRKRGLRW